MSKDKKVWQIQRFTVLSDYGKPEWRDVCSELGVQGPAIKAKAKAFLLRIRLSNPGLVYRIVKVSPL